MTYRAIEWSLAALALAGCVEKHAFVADDGPLPVPPGTTGVSVARLLSEYRGYPSEVKDDWQLDVVVTAVSGASGTPCGFGTRREGFRSRFRATSCFSISRSGSRCGSDVRGWC